MPSDQDYLPPFAEQWMQQWKAAAPKLQAIRDRELRNLDTITNPPAEAGTATRKLSHAEARNHGLAIQQAWFMRFMLLQKTKPDQEKGASDEKRVARKKH